MEIELCTDMFFLQGYSTCRNCTTLCVIWLIGIVFCVDFMEWSASSRRISLPKKVWIVFNFWVVSIFLNDDALQCCARFDCIWIVSFHNFEIATALRLCKVSLSLSQFRDLWPIYRDSQYYHGETDLIGGWKNSVPR